MNRLLMLCGVMLLPFAFLFCRGKAGSGVPGFPVANAVTHPGSEQADARGFAVVELFTSEGCSSCPAAERAVEDLVKDAPVGVYLLSYHVDYWERLGWKDPFSDPQFTQRQGDYSRLFHLQSIYTPQVVVNGVSEFVGSDRSRLQGTVNQQLNGKKELPEGFRKTEISLDVAREKQQLKVSYSVTGAPGGQLRIALVQDEASSEIRRGENAGRNMHHVRIVRDLHSVSPGEGFVRFTQPPGVRLDRFRVIAFLQTETGVIVNLAETRPPGSGDEGHNNQ